MRFPDDFPEWEDPDTMLRYALDITLFQAFVNTKDDTNDNNTTVDVIELLTWATPEARDQLEAGIKSALVDHQQPSFDTSLLDVSLKLHASASLSLPNAAATIAASSPQWFAAPSASRHRALHDEDDRDGGLRTTRRREATGTFRAPLLRTTHIPRIVSASRGAAFTRGASVRRPFVGGATDRKYRVGPPSPSILKRVAACFFPGNRAVQVLPDNAGFFVAGPVAHPTTNTIPRPVVSAWEDPSSERHDIDFLGQLEMIGEGGFGCALLDGRKNLVYKLHADRDHDEAYLTALADKIDLVDPRGDHLVKLKYVRFSQTHKPSGTRCSRAYLDRSSRGGAYTYHALQMPYAKQGDFRNYAHKTSLGNDHMRLHTCALKIAEAAAFMNAKGWVHGDLKDQNVLVFDNGALRLNDYDFLTHVDDKAAVAEKLATYVDFAARYFLIPPEFVYHKLMSRGHSDFYIRGYTSRVVEGRVKGLSNYVSVLYHNYIKKRCDDRKWEIERDLSKSMEVRFDAYSLGMLMLMHPPPLHISKEYLEKYFEICANLLHLDPSKRMTCAGAARALRKMLIETRKSGTSSRRK